MCILCKEPDAKVIKKGFFIKKSKIKVQRYRCLSCRRSFSDQTGRSSYRLRKSHLRGRIFRLLCSGVSQRRIAYNLGVHHDTVARYLQRIAKDARQMNQDKVNLTQDTIVFDEMETFEHTKCKPVSIVVAVEEKTRQILALEAAQMPAKGHLAKISRAKYGRRADHRPAAIRKVLNDLAGFESVRVLKSDDCPRYPRYIRECTPFLKHMTYKGRRGCIVGQGELKRGGFDPLFSLNHTCAELRDCIKRLSRRTWCTTKIIPRLQMLLEIYMCYFNQKLRGVRVPKLRLC